MACKVVNIDPEQLTDLMRLQPTLEDTAKFFKCSPDTIERHIKKLHPGMTFAEFREENKIFTRMALVRTAVQKALKGDNIMLIFCLKNMCDWRDKPKDEDDPFAKMSMHELVIFIKSKIPELEKATGMKILEIEKVPG